MRNRATVMGTTIALCLLGAATPALAAAPPSNFVPVDRVKIPGGVGTTLFKGRDVRVVGSCIDNGGGDLIADTRLEAKKDDLRAFASYDDVSDLDFDEGDPPIDITGDDASGTAESYTAEDYDQDFYVENATGEVSQGQVTSGVHVRGGNGCTFSGLFVDSNSTLPVRTIPRLEVDAGESTTIYLDKNFKVSGECVDNGGGDLTAATAFKARRNNLAYQISDSGAVDADFDKSAPPQTLSAAYFASGSDPAFLANDYYQEFWGEAPGGRPLDARVASGVHVGGADCTFSGIFAGPKSEKGLRVLKQTPVDAGDSLTLFKNRSFKVTGECEDGGGGDLDARSFVEARRPDMLMWVGETAVVDSDFDPSDGKLDFAPTYLAFGTDPDFSGLDYYQEFLGEGKGGQILNGRVSTGVHIAGADCTFSGIFAG